jgi:heptosyltransferase-2
MSQGKILVIRGGAIGDFILTLPVLAALRRQFPDTALAVLGYPHIAALAAAGQLVDAVRPIEARPLAGFFARAGDLDFELSSYFAGCNVIFSYLFDPDEIFRDNLARITKAQVIQGPHRPLETRDLHATEQLLEPLQRLAIFDAEGEPRINLNPAPAAQLRPTLALHPGSGGERKNWPEPAWRELIGKLVESTDLDLLLVGGEAEGGRLERLAGAVTTNRVRVRRGIPLPALAAELRGCVGFAGHDSGISHLAAAVGLPGLVLWGPTNVTVWRPRSARFDVLSGGDDLSALGVETVWEALRRRVSEWRQPQPKAT